MILNNPGDIMALFEWKEEFSVKVGAFDSHHKRLVDLIGSLHEAMLKRKSAEVIGGILKELLAYTRYHFSEEEKIMTSMSYPGLQQHRKEHDWFTEKVAAFVQKQQQGALGVGIETMSFLKNWLVDHILETDKQYSGFFNSRNVS